MIHNIVSVSGMHRKSTVKEYTYKISKIEEKSGATLRTQFFTTS